MKSLKFLSLGYTVVFITHLKLYQQPSDVVTQDVSSVRECKECFDISEVFGCFILIRHAYTCLIATSALPVRRHHANDILTLKYYCISLWIPQMT